MKPLILFAFFIFALPAVAEDGSTVDPQTKILLEKFQGLRPQTGTVALGGGIAQVQVPNGLQFLDAGDSKTILVDFWGNPPQSAEGILGMLIESPEAAVSEKGWGIVVTYSGDGHVIDEDAQSIDYASMLKKMQSSTREANEERQKAGYPSIQLVGWAEPPHYDQTNHKIFWAKELEFGDDPEHTLNYATRILGRQGVLELNAVAGMSDLGEIREKMQNVLGSVDFTEGNRYADFNPATDQLAGYGVAALVAGSAAAKMGFFKSIIAGLLAAKKLVIVAAVAALAGIAKLWKGRKP